MRYRQFSVRDTLDKVKFFSQESVEVLVNFSSLRPDGRSDDYTQVLCKIDGAENVVVFIWGDWAEISFLSPVFPGDLEAVAACVEYAGGRMFDSRRRVRGSKRTNPNLG